MAAGVLLDTSFLITLADMNRGHHETARRYWRYFLDDGFDHAFFDANGQRDFTDDLNAASSEPS